MCSDLTVIRMAYLIERDYKEFYQETSEMVEDENVKELLLNSLIGKMDMRSFLKKSMTV